jgi:hypothetical protein
LLWLPTIPALLGSTKSTLLGSTKCALLRCAESGLLGPLPVLLLRECTTAESLLLWESSTEATCALVRPHHVGVGIGRRSLLPRAWSHDSNDAE